MKNFFRSKSPNKGVIYIDERSRRTDNLLTFDEMKKIIVRERARSDRHNHEFSVVVIEIEKFDQENGLVDQLVLLLGSRLRMTDEIGWYHNNQIALILPYTSSENAVLVAEDVIQIISTKIPAKISKILSYPSIWPYKNKSTS